MSYPQPVASQEILEGQEFVRVKTLLTSSGDAYELNVSAKAFAIGPESDVARARITYFDPIHGPQSVIVGVGCPFFGRIDAKPKDVYPGSSTPANIIITPEDAIESQAIIDTAFSAADAPREAINGLNLRGFVQPKLDLIAYLSEPKTLPQQRADAIYRGNLVMNSGENALHDTHDPAETNTYLYFPFYGRKYMSFKIKNGTAYSYSYRVHGLTFNPGTGGVTSEYLTAWTAVATGTVGSAEVRASASGQFDYLAVVFSGSVTYITPAMPYTAQISDKEE